MHLAAKLALAGFVPVSLLAGNALLGRGCPLSCDRGAQQAIPADQAAASDQEVSGHYVEARSASVYAGACHFGSEYTTQGRQAVMAWALDGGSEHGVPLAGVQLVAVVSAQGNLAEQGSARESVVYLDADLPQDVRTAALSWLEREHGDALGTVRRVKTGDVSVDSTGERYAVQVAGLVHVAGEAMPDRACCSMPENVLYQPLTAVDGRLVGQSEVLEVSDPDVGPSFVRRAENDAFVGTIPSRAQASCTAGAPLCPWMSRMGCCGKDRPAAEATP